MCNKFLLFILLLMFSLPFNLTVVQAGERICSQNMDITDIRFSVKGEVTGPVAFDDIGCAIIWRNELCAMEQLSFDYSAETYDYYTKETIKLDSAFFVVESGIETPLHYGIAAFKDSESAKKFISEHGRGKILTFNELAARKFR